MNKLVVKRAAEAEAIAAARKWLSFLKDNTFDMVGVQVAPFSPDSGRRFAVEVIKSLSRTHPLHMMRTIDGARSGWDLADQALRELFIEYTSGGERVPTELQAWSMEAIAGLARPPRQTGPKKADKIWRDLFLIITIGLIAEQFSLLPTRNRASRGASACSVVAAAAAAERLAISEEALAKIWKKYGSHFGPIVHGRQFL